MKLFHLVLLAGLLASLTGRGHSSEADSVGGAKKLSKLPWHLADVGWSLDEATPGLESLDIDVTSDRDVPSTVNLYIAPCGLGELSGIKFYGGLQSNINGWQSRANSKRVHLGVRRHPLSLKEPVSRDSRP